MQILGKSRVKRCAALLLAIFLILPLVPVSAANAPQPRASDYLEECSASVYCADGGVIKVRFGVTGTGEMDELGALEIQLYESTDNTNWVWVATYAPADYPNLMGHNEVFYSSYVTYTQGISGRYYRAFVYIIARDNGGSGSYCFFTSSKLAP